MKHLHRQFLYLAAGVTALLALSQVTGAQTYPSRPITIIVHSRRVVPQRHWGGLWPST